MLSPPDGYVVSFTHFHERGFATPPTDFFEGCCTTTRLSCSISIPTGSSTWWRSSPCARGSWRSTPTSICGGTSLSSPSRRRGRRAASRSCTCRWGVPASSSGTIGSTSTRRCGYQCSTRCDTCNGSTLRTTLPPPTRVHWTPDRRGPGVVEEVGCPGEGQEEDLGPQRRHPHPQENGLKGSGVIGAYHARRVVPLLMRALPLYMMAPEASFDGTALTFS